MSDDTVDVSIRGERAFPVNRHNLANRMQFGEIIARRLGKRPGEPTGKLEPDDDLSSDVMSTMITVYIERRKRTP